MRIPWKEEHIAARFTRVKVIGGWIVYNYTSPTEAEATFVPDEQHIWKIQ